VGITQSLGPFGGLTGTYIPGDVQQQIPDSKAPESSAEPERFVRQTTPEFSRTPGKEKKREMEEEIAENEGLGFGF
jgi:hypothetical protein